MNLKKHNYSLLCSLGSLGRRLWNQHLQREMEKAGFRRSWSLMPAHQQSQLTPQGTLELKCHSVLGQGGQDFIFLHWSLIECGLPRKGQDLDKALSAAGQSLKRLAAEVCLPTVLPAAGTTDSSLKRDLGATSSVLSKPWCIYLKVGKI